MKKNAKLWQLHIQSKYQLSWEIHPCFHWKRIVNADLHTWTDHYSKLNLAYPHFNHETEDGRTFSLSATRLWNQQHIDQKTKATTVASFREALDKYFLTSYDEVEHFSPNAI